MVPEKEGVRGEGGGGGYYIRRERSRWCLGTEGVGSEMRQGGIR